MINFVAMDNIIGIVAATKMELSPILNNNLPGEFRICITGIGSVATTYNLLTFIQQYKPAFIIQAGIAGCFDKNIPLSSFFTVERDCFADLGVMEKDNWKDMFDMELVSKNETPFNNGWLVNKTDTTIFENEKKTTSITVNEITTSTSKNKSWLDKYGATLESLEGAAFHYVCLMQGIPFLQVRTISNYVGERDKTKWETEKAILHLNRKLHELAGKLKNENLV